MTALVRIAVLAWARWREVAYYLSTRTANGAVSLVHAYVVIAALGESEGGRYFLFWTAAWLLCVAMRLGVDGVMPRLVAESALNGTPVPSLRPAVRWSLALGVVGAPCILLAFGLPQGATAAAACVLVSAAWSLTHVMGSLLRASRHIAWSGVVTNVVWTVGSAAAPLGLLVTDHSWVTLAWLTVATSVVAAGVSVFVVVRVMGIRLLHQLAARSSPARVLDRDTVGAACLGVLVETLTWLPVLLAAGFGRPADVAVVFAATRLAGPFSWGYQAVVAVLSPRLAAALAARRLERTAVLLRRGSVAGIMVTLPACVVGVVLAPHLIEVLLGRPSEDGTLVLRLLIAARGLDALTGPVGESLLIGRRTWLDVGLISSAIAAGVALTADVATTSSAVAAAGLGAAATFVLVNVVRLVVVRRLLAHDWRIDARPAARDAGPAALAGLGATASAMAWSGIDGYVATFVAIAGSVVLIAAAAWWGIRRVGARALILSPAGLALLLLATHFTLRPAAIATHPAAMTPGLQQIGFTWSDFAHAIGLGALGFAVLVAFYAAGTQREPHRGARLAALPRERRVLVGAAATLLLGSVLWGALFVRLGGVGVLVTNPAALHLNQFGGSYGTFGTVLCLGATLALLWVWLERPSRRLAWALAAAASVCVGSSIALASRGPLVATAIAAALLALRHRRPRRQTVIALAAASVLVFSANAFARQVREYAQGRSMSDAIVATAHADPLVVLSGDLVEFDHAVAVVTVVPDGLPYLNGESLADIPKAFLPRALYTRKPLPIDFRLSRVMYGPTTTAGTPPTLPGEFFWNFGLLGALVAMAVTGGLLAALGRVLVAAGAFGTAAWCVTVGYCYLLLTRPVAYMLLLLAMALAGFYAAACAMGLVDVRMALAVPARRAQALRSARTAELSP